MNSRKESWNVERVNVPEVATTLKIGCLDKMSE